MKKIKFGIIGCSSIAERTVIPAILKAKNSELSFVGSRTEEKAKKFAKKFSCKKYGSYKEVLENNDIDAVYISLPIALQEKMVLDSAKAKKHILCEKSSTISFRSAEKMIQTCKKNNVQILEGFSFIHHPQQKKVSEYIKNNKIGDVFSFIGKYGFILPYSKNNFRFNKELGGGVLNDVGCYLIKASRMIFETNPISVNCNLYSEKKSDVDLKGSIYMKFPNNKIAVGLFSYLDNFQSNYEIWGQKGSISLERAFNAKYNVSTSIQTTIKDKIEKFKTKPTNQSEKMILYFCDVITNSKNKSNLNNELLNQALVMEKARLSNDMQKTILL
jgi:predicted dehydrogenase